MCRLLAYACREARSVADVLGPAELANFRQLSHLHHDGWGMSWLEEMDSRGQPAPSGSASEAVVGPGPLQVKRSTVPAFEDPEFEAWAQRPLGRAGLVHLRWATPGLDVNEANTHPFLAAGWAFAHQGSIQGPERLDDLLAPHWAGQRRGTTDSERYFFLLLQSIEQENDLVRGVQNAVRDVTKTCGPASLNAILLSPSALVFVHGRDDVGSPAPEHMMEAAGSIPRDHLDNYLKIRYRHLGDGLVVASSGLSRDGWEEVQPSSLLHVDLAEMSMSIHDL
jgi:predicted glutamine amidotransferase